MDQDLISQAVVAARLGCAAIPVVLGITDRLILDPAHRFLVTPLTEPGRSGVEMDLLATGCPAGRKTPGLRHRTPLLGGTGD